ncbi:MAG: DNA polymerase I [Mariprofundaceae bacterium]|nr:DNA polymerase I [Mariprofundaceae bacterium]
MPHLALIDGPNYVFRAFHAIRQLSNSKGEPTNAVFGYVQMLRSILKELQPTHVAVAFDPKGGTFRNDMYADYKAHRPPMPEDLAVQWPHVFEVTRGFNLPLIQIENFEADDVIATLARQAERKGWDVTIVSTDKDLMQLIGNRIWMLDTMKRIEYGADEVKARWGVSPDRIHDLLALAGDTSDNIPGVPGIGPKTAVELLNAYGDLEGVLEHAPEIKQHKRRENLIQYAGDARLSYRLVALDEQTPVGMTLDELTIRSPDREKLRNLFEQLEFHRLMEEFATQPSGKPAPEQQQERTDILVDTPETLKQLIVTLKSAKLIAVDTETTSLCCHDADLVGLSFAVRPGEGWYVPVGHRSDDLFGETPRQLPGADVLSALKPVLENPDTPKCGHNLKYDVQVLRRAGIELAGIGYDSMLLAYVDEPGQSAKMDHVALKYLGHRCISYAEVAGKGAKRINFSHVPLATALPYAAEDAEVTLRLTHYLCEKLASRIQRHTDIELPLSRVLADMEWIGAHLDTDKLAELSGRFGKRIDELERHIHRAAGNAFNIQSPKQLGVLLFETLALPGGKKTKSGQWATGQEVLEQLAEEHAAPRLILEVRQLAKLKSTYTDALQKLIHPQTGRVHTSYNQAVTTTGRLSSSDPNLQNIPIRSEEGREIRKAFTAEGGNLLIAADYSQIELRLMAHFSGDKVLSDAFARGEDIHAATAAAVNQVALHDVTRDMRRRAKIINFGILYGMSAFGLAKQLGAERGEAQAFIDAYFAQYPAIHRFMEKTLERARAQGYVETLLGHRVYVPEINAKNGLHRQYAERTAINAPLQGSAADIIKVAMIHLHARLAKEASEACMILQVHDELVVECPESMVKDVSDIMREEMESVIPLNVPLIVDIGQGKNWFAAH